MPRGSPRPALALRVRLRYASGEPAGRGQSQLVLNRSGKLAAVLGHHRDALRLAQPAAGVGDVVQRGLAEQKRAEDLGEQHVRVAVLEHLGGEITR